jgi:hypothetical protein
MTERPTEPDGPSKGRDEVFWAKPVEGLHIDQDLPEDAVNLNVEGKRLAGLTGGFGKMWQKTYQVALGGHEIAPERVIKEWKENFPSFWPKGSVFYGPMAEISPGDVALLNLKMPGRVKMSTGVLVLYADEESFTFMTPEGHQFNGMITFSARHEGEETVAQAQALIRAQDPLYELAMILGGHRKEDKHWEHTLEALARHLGVGAKATSQRTCVDRKRQWSAVGNIKHNAGIRSVLHALAGPFRALAKPFRRRASVSE